MSGGAATKCHSYAALMSKARHSPLAQSLVVLSGAAVGYLGGALPWIDRWRRADRAAAYRGFTGFWRWSNLNAHVMWSSLGLGLCVVGLILVVAGITASSWWSGVAALGAAGLGVAMIALLHGSGFAGLDRSDAQAGAWVALVAGLDAAVASPLVRARAGAFRARVSRDLRVAARPARGVMDYPLARGADGERLVGSPG
jgi:hypothetical protein